jgi:hypothetical protein
MRKGKSSAAEDCNFLEESRRVRDELARKFPTPDDILRELNAREQRKSERTAVKPFEKQRSGKATRISAVSRKKPTAGREVLRRKKAV